MQDQQLNIERRLGKLDLLAHTGIVLPLESHTRIEISTFLADVLLS